MALVVCKQLFGENISKMNYAWVVLFGCYYLIFAHNYISCPFMHFVVFSGSSIFKLCVWSWYWKDHAVWYQLYWVTIKTSRLQLPSGARFLFWNMWSQ